MLYFSLDFKEELEFIPIIDNVMYYREQDEQGDEEFVSTFGSVEGLNDFE